MGSLISDIATKRFKMVVTSACYAVAESQVLHGLICHHKFPQCGSQGINVLFRFEVSVLKKILLFRLHGLPAIVAS